MSGKTWTRFSPGPDTRKTFVPNFATFGIMTKPFQIELSFAFSVKFEKSEGVPRESGDLRNNKNWVATRLIELSSINEAV